MRYLTYNLEQEKFINRFITTGTYCKAQQFTKATLSGKVNEWLQKGFSIHENPCRKEFIDKRLAKTPEYIDISQMGIGDEVEVFDIKKKLYMYFPFGNVNVEASEFYYNPMYLRTYSYTYIYSEMPSVETFEVTTCGGVTLWVNDENVLDFTPFTRNMKKSCQTTFSLKQGLNKLVVCLDDLAERDTDYYFRIEYKGNNKMQIYLPISNQVNEQEIYRVEEMLEDISFEKEVYINEKLQLDIKNKLDRALDICVEYKPIIDKIHNQGYVAKYIETKLDVKQDKLSLFHTEEVIPGFYYFQVKSAVAGIEISRKIATQIFDRKLMGAKDLDAVQRKVEALKFVQEVEINNVYKAATIYKLDGDYRLAEKIICEELEGINLRKDCSDFHLIIVIHIYKEYKDKLSEDLIQKIEDTLIHFRYWIDEPGDDVMWFFSENHALLFHICQYLAGSLLPEATFTNSGRKGQELRERALDLLDEWFEGFSKEFITEWNSNAYIPIDVLGLGSLYNLTKDNEKLNAKAKESLDAIFYSMAINAHKGALITTFGRSYEKELKGNYTAGTSSLLYLGYNKGYLNRAVIAYISIILGDYEAPKEYGQYILEDDQKMIFRNTQGYQEHVDLYMYKDKYAQLSTAVNFNPFKAGYQEHIMQAVINPTAQAFINHPGEVHPYGNGRPNFWAGNGTLPKGMQYKNIGVLVYDIDESHLVDYTHAYFPLSEFQNYMGNRNCIVAEQEEAYIGVYALNGLEMQMKGPCKYREFMSKGRKNVWVMKIGNKEEYKSMLQFIESMNEMRVTMDEMLNVTLRDEKYGELYIPRDGVVEIDGICQYTYPMPMKGKIEIL